MWPTNRSTKLDWVGDRGVARLEEFKATFKAVKQARKVEQCLIDRSGSPSSGLR